MQCFQVAGGLCLVAIDIDINIPEQVLSDSAFVQHAADKIRDRLTALTSAKTDKVGHGVFGEDILQGGPLLSVQ